MRDRAWKITYPLWGTWLFALYRWDSGRGWYFDKYLTEDEAGRFYE